MKRKDSNPWPWRIDALDARAGIAFASQRESFNLSHNEVEPADHPGVFISAPDFQAESLSSSAIGYAATRNSFQLGLFVGDDAEVGFKTLPELIEFVRRCYVRGSGGDDNGAGQWDFGMPPVDPEQFSPPPTDDSAKSSTRPPETPSCISSLLAEIEEGFKASSNCMVSPEVQSHPCNFYNEKSLKLLPVGADSLMSAAECILDELRSRFPTHGTPSDKYRWGRSAITLGRFLYQQGFYSTSPDIGKWSWLINNLTNIYSRGTAEILFLDTPFQEVGGAPTAAQDLMTWPVPRRMAKRLKLANPSMTTVHDLLTTILASPFCLLSGKSGEATLCLEIALLASVHLTRHDSTAPRVIREQANNSPLISSGKLSSSSAEIYRLTFAAQLGWDWLLKQFPKYFYPKELEQLIDEVAQLGHTPRYQTTMTSK